METQTGDTPQPTSQPAASWPREYLRDYYRSHRNAETLTAEDLEQCRRNPALAREIRDGGVLACLECGLLVKSLPPHLPHEHGMRSEEYKRKWGLPNNFPLLAKDLSAKLARIKIAAGHLPPVEKRFGQPGVSSQRLAWKARRERGGSLVERQARRERMLASVRTGRAEQLHPEFWRKVRSKKLSRVDVAARRIRGESIETIARDLKVSSSSIREILQKIGVPSTDFVLWHGEPLCWHHLSWLVQDYIAVKHLALLHPQALSLASRQKFSLVQTAKLLEVSRDWAAKWKNLLHLGTRIGGHVYLGNAEVKRLAAERDRIAERQAVGRARREITHALRANPVWISIRSNDASKPFSRRMNTRIFSFWSGLQTEWRKQSSSSAGGRPQKLLPSEKAILPRRYRSVRKDLNQLRQAVRQGRVRHDRRNLRAIHEWICEQAACGKMRSLLLWPQFFTWYRTHEEWDIDLNVPNELAMAFLADQFSVGLETIRRALLQ